MRRRMLESEMQQNRTELHFESYWFKSRTVTRTSTDVGAGGVQLAPRGGREPIGARLDLK